MTLWGWNRFLVLSLLGMGEGENILGPRVAKGEAKPTSSTLPRKYVLTTVTTSPQVALETLQGTGSGRSCLATGGVLPSAFWVLGRPGPCASQHAQGRATLKGRQRGVWH